MFYPLYYFVLLALTKSYDIYRQVSTKNLRFSMKFFLYFIFAFITVLSTISYKNKNFYNFCKKKSFMKEEETTSVKIGLDANTVNDYNAMYITGNCLNGIFSGHFTLENNAQIIYIT